ncbi:MAG: DUF1254 domain-containing protein [Holophagaceae bacterium]|nr:DUF1254 domain-containing protein [Holophagaceae bacterium]
MLSLLITAIGCHQTDNDVAEEPQIPSGELWKIVEDAYTFTFPLVMMGATMQASTNTEVAITTQAPVNQIFHAKRLARAESKLIVTPNVDTLYSQAFFDLSKDALVFRKPAVGRYCSVQLLDQYTNCIATLGTGSDTQDERLYLFSGPGFSGDAPEWLTRVNFPTNNAWMLIRTIVEDDEDLENVYAIQAEMKLVPLAAYLINEFDYDPPKGEYKAENDFVPIQHVLAMPPMEYFSFANELMAINPPAPEDSAMLERIAKIGVGPPSTLMRPYWATIQSRSGKL